MSSVLLDQLIEALRCLPGVGPKSAQRMAYHLLERNRDGARRLSSQLATAMDEIGHCTRCRTFTEQSVCTLCSNPRRDHSILCVVESPADLLAIEQSASYSGLYFVLMGHLSPLDGIEPEDIGVDEYERRLDSGEITEVVLATNLTVEGETTAWFLSELARARGIKVTRIAHGVPVGGELEYVDASTLARALAGRQLIESTD